MLTIEIHLLLQITYLKMLSLTKLVNYGVSYAWKMMLKSTPKNDVHSKAVEFYFSKVVFHRFFLTLQIGSIGAYNFYFDSLLGDLSAKFASLECRHFCQRNSEIGSHWG